MAHRPAIRAEDPALAFSRALHLFAPKRADLFPAGIHPDATVTERSSVSLSVGSLSLVRDGSQYVRIVGQVRNDQPSRVKNVILSGVLLDAQGEIVSLGSAYLAVAEGVEPGESAGFEIRIHDSAYSVETPFVNYRVYLQAERGGD